MKGQARASSRGRSSADRKRRSGFACRGSMRPSRSFRPNGWRTPGRGRGRTIAGRIPGFYRALAQGSTAAGRGPTGNSSGKRSRGRSGRRFSRRAKSLGRRSSRTSSLCVTVGYKTLQATVDRGGTFVTGVGRKIDLPHDFALRFEVPVADAWAKCVLKEIRRGPRLSPKIA